MSWFIRQRQDFIRAQLQAFGMIRRADIMRKFEVSMPQASADIQQYIADHPDAIDYDRVAKCYVFNDPNAASLPPATDPAMGLDGNDIWEALFGIMRGNVPDEMTEEVCSQLAAALAAAPTIPATGETWESVAAWCEQTFGPCTPYRMATRAGEELAELVEEAQSLSWSDKARIEAADVLICLSRVPGIWAAVEQKMAINRARKWNVQGDGTGYHIPATGHAATEGEGA